METEKTTMKYKIHILILAVLVCFLFGCTEKPVKSDETDEPVKCTAVYRMENRRTGEHLYTVDVRERDTLYRRGWKYEGTAWQAPVTSDTPVYRLNRPDRDVHIYTADPEECADLTEQGWEDEGICFYSDDKKEVPIYGVSSGNDDRILYTASAGERDALIHQGWSDMGTVWYGRQDTAEEAALPQLTDEENIQQELNGMSLQDRVNMLFVSDLDSLGGHGTLTVTSSLQSAIARYHPGGIIFFAENLQNPDQTRKLMQDIRKLYSDEGLDVPILAVDEEGGTVSRIARNPAFGVTDVGDMAEIGKTGDVSEAYAVGDTIGTYLSDLGINTDFAPDADVRTDPQNQITARRSFGTDPHMVKVMSGAECEALKAHGILSALKHYPGHGAASQDSHNGTAVSYRTLEELKESELVPFTDVNAYAPMIMAGHISCPNVTGDMTPASLSYRMITEILRGQLNYDGVIITDSLRMGAVSLYYSSGEASVRALEAGCDLLLMPVNLSAAVQGVTDAVNSGRLSQERIDESCTRILLLKRKIS